MKEIINEMLESKLNEAKIDPKLKAVADKHGVQLKPTKQHTNLTTLMPLLRTFMMLDTNYHIIQRKITLISIHMRYMRKKLKNQRLKAHKSHKVELKCFLGVDS